MKNDISFKSEVCGHLDCLEKFALKFCNNLDDAQDLVQDTIIKAIRHHHLYEPGTNLRGWLFTILRNTFINDYRRTNKRRQLIDTCEDLNSVQLSHSSEKNLSGDKFLMKDIQKALRTLPKDCSYPFLRYFEGYKYHEIAEELNIPIGTVKTRIHMARKLLKAQLNMYAGLFGSQTAA